MRAAKDASKARPNDFGRLPAESRRWISEWPPAGTSRTYRAAAFVPVFAGFTASRLPSTTYWWNESFTQGDGFDCPQSRKALLSFSVKRSSGDPSHDRVISPRAGCDATTAPPASRRTGFVPPSPHDQVLRNHSVG